MLEEQVGIAGDIEAETQAILIENGVDQTDFPPSVLDSLPKVDADGVWRIPEEELAKRRDLRKEQIFSIDPPTARDLDDALSWRPLDNGYGDFDIIWDHLRGLFGLLTTPHTPWTVLYVVAMRIGC